MTTYNFTVRAIDANSRVALSAQSMVVLRTLPAILSGKRGAWIDPGDVSTLWQDSARTVPVASLGDPVGCADDKSGNGHFFTQATASRRPTWQQDANGLYYLSFDPTQSQFLSAGTTLALAPRTDEIFVGCAVDIADTATRPMLCRSIASGVSGRYGLRQIATSMAAMIYDDPEGGTAPGPEASFSYTNTGKHVYSGVAARGSDQLYVRVDGVTGQTITNGHDTGADRASSWRTLLGAYGNSTDTGETAYYSGKIYGAVVMFDAAISAEDRDGIEAALASAGAGAAAPTAYRYYRMNISANNGGAYTGISEMELRGSIGGADLVPLITSTDARVLFSSEYAANPAYCVFNNNLGGTSWFTNTGGATPCYIGWDFGTPTVVREIAYGTLPTAPADRAPKDFTFEGSNDGTSWNVLSTQTGKAGTGGAFVAYAV